MESVLQNRKSAVEIRDVTDVCEAKPNKVGSWILQHDLVVDEEHHLRLADQGACVNSSVHFLSWRSTTVQGKEAAAVMSASQSPQRALL